VRSFLISALIPFFLIITSRNPAGNLPRRRHELYFPGSHKEPGNAFQKASCSTFEKGSHHSLAMDLVLAQRQLIILHTCSQYHLRASQKKGCKNGLCKNGLNDRTISCHHHLLPYVRRYVIIENVPLLLKMFQMFQLNNTQTLRCRPNNGGILSQGECLFFFLLRCLTPNDISLLPPT
jgi:hypothetical protein